MFRIRVDPYQIARLARRLQISTGDFAAAWTRQGAGTALRQNDDGACVFLGPEGCTVHPDRPLACRIYPLRHEAWRNGAERFTRLALEPGTKGRFTDEGTIEAYLKQQGADEYLDASWLYFDFLCKAEDLLGKIARSDEAAEAVSATLAAELLDMDGAIARRCAVDDQPEPEALEERLELHLTILYDALGAVAERER